MWKSCCGVLILLMCTACSTADLQRTLGTVLGGTLSEAEVGSGLKEALRVGITKGAKELAQEGGYFDSPYRILLPPEAREVTDRLQGVPGFTELEAEILRKINQGAEDAAKSAAPIFIDAIKAITFADAMNILRGADDAATEYLREKTFEALYQEFNPVIIESLDKFDARKIWSDAVTAYNRIPILEDVNPDLADYVTRQALDGLFAKVAVEEQNIRTDVSARTSDLLRRVFAAQDDIQRGD